MGLIWEGRKEIKKKKKKKKEVMNDVTRKEKRWKKKRVHAYKISNKSLYFVPGITESQIKERKKDRIKLNL